MGCMDREPLTKKDLDYEEREARAVKAIRDISLSSLTVADSLAIHAAFFHRHFGINERDIETFEKILKRVAG